MDVDWLVVAHKALPLPHTNAFDRTRVSSSRQAPNACAKRVHAHTIAFPAYMTVYCFGTVVLSDGPDLVGHVQGYSQLSKGRTTRRPDPCWCYRMLVTAGRNSSLISLEKKILINNSTCSDISGAFPTKNHLTLTNILLIWADDLVNKETCSKESPLFYSDNIF